MYILLHLYIRFLIYLHTFYTKYIEARYVTTVSFNKNNRKWRWGSDCVLASLNSDRCQCGSTPLCALLFKGEESEIQRREITCHFCVAGHQWIRNKDPGSHSLWYFPATMLLHGDLPLKVTLLQHGGPVASSCRQQLGAAGATCLGLPQQIPGLTAPQPQGSLQSSHCDCLARTWTPLPRSYHLPPSSWVQ